MTEAICLEASEKTEAAKKAGRRVSVSGIRTTSTVNLSIAYISLSDFFAVPLCGTSFSDLSLCSMAAFFSGSLSISSAMTSTCFSSCACSAAFSCRAALFSAR
ncbi:hypothetical protein D3Z38_12760 [Clostridiales bacterium]|nr:hypothetical protein [Clostridiales bacterium]